MSIEIYSDSKVYVLLHTNKPSGGTELLHQLVFHLRNNLNIDAALYYPFKGEAVHPSYTKYKNKVIRHVEDNKHNILIYPEATWIIDEVRKFKNIRKGMWWLSVDNFYLSYIAHNKKNFLFQRIINKVTNLLLKKTAFEITDLIYKKYYNNNDFILNKFLRDFVLEADFHLAQSYYSMNHLKNINISKKDIFYLSDYLSEEFLKTNVDISKKEDIVVYNPKKGYQFTQKIIKIASDINFIPIINMSREEVIEILKKAKVYIDFGNHPGKDRIPREAAILGCCVITGKRGSAKYYEDIPIPSNYKFEDKYENIPKIINKIKDCLKNFNERYKDFEIYRNTIKNEPKKFIKDLEQIFKKV